mgnify:CR=1 FL=1
MEVNEVYCMDNLKLMKHIPDNFIDLIYCDILYGTGRNFGDYLDLKPMRSEIEDHYLPRIKEMKRVLKSTGSIYLQMDTKINHWIRCLMDDIFGYDKFQCEIIWVYGSGLKAKSKKFHSHHDSILFYSKNNTHIFNHQYIKLKEPNKRWKTSTINGKNVPTRDENGKQETYFVDEQEIGNVWTDIPMRRNGILYKTEKPMILSERIIKASSNEGNLVVDFYCGSGTTLAAAKKLNRNYIGCDINPRAVEISKERIKNTITPFII